MLRMVFVTTGGSLTAAFTGNLAIVTTGGALLVGAGATISGDILPDAVGIKRTWFFYKRVSRSFTDGTNG